MKMKILKVQMTLKMNGSEVGRLFERFEDLIYERGCLVLNEIVCLFLVLVCWMLMLMLMYYAVSAVDEIPERIWDKHSSFLSNGLWRYRVVDHLI
jgi:hypothetical protein